MQKIYVFVLTKTYSVTKKFGERVNNVIIGICSFLIVLNCFLYTGWSSLDIGITLRYAEMLPLNAVFLCIILLFSVNDELKPVQWKRHIYIPWIVCWILIIASGIHHNISDSFLFTAISMFVIFPGIYLVWNSRNDINTLYRYFCIGTVCAFALYFIYSLFKFPMDVSIAYYGIATNPNSNGLIGLAGIIASMYLICVDRRKMYLYIITAGMAVALIYISSSRASLIAASFVLIAFIICYFRSIRERRSTLLKTIIAAVIILATLLFSIIGYRYIFINVTPKISNSIISEISLNVYALSEENEDTYTDPLLEKLRREGDAAQVSSGRTQIWKEYAESLNITGHERDKYGLYIKSLNRNASAHNTYLEVAYRSGIIAGLTYVFIAIYAAIYSFRFMFGKKLFDYRLSFVPMAVMAFGVMSNLERAIYPLEKVHILMFFLALIPMMAAARKKNEDSNTSE